MCGSHIDIFFKKQKQNKTSFYHSSPWLKGDCLQNKPEAQLHGSLLALAFFLPTVVCPLFKTVPGVGMWGGSKGYVPTPAGTLNMLSIQRQQERWAKRSRGHKERETHPMLGSEWSVHTGAHNTSFRSLCCCMHRVNECHWAFHPLPGSAVFKCNCHSGLLPSSCWSRHLLLLFTMQIK